MRRLIDSSFRDTADAITIFTLLSRPAPINTSDIIALAGAALRGTKVSLRPSVPRFRVLLVGL